MISLEKFRVSSVSPCRRKTKIWEFPDVKRLFLLAFSVKGIFMVCREKVKSLRRIWGNASVIVLFLGVPQGKVLCLIDLDFFTGWILSMVEMAVWTLMPYPFLWTHS